MQKEVKKTTYERIIDASLELFNAEGERQISTNHIAAYMGISPGNLYYHFNNKDEIIVILFRQYRNEMLDLIRNVKTPENIPELVRFMEDVMDIMWDYRFFFSDVNTLLSRSKELYGEHEQFNLALIDPIIRKVVLLMKNKEVLDIDDIDIKIILGGFWIVLKYWFVFDRSRQGTLDKTSKHRAVLQIIGMMRRYFIGEHRQACEDYLQKEISI